MKRYIIKTIIIAKPQDSIDGKRHQKTNYYVGQEDFGGLTLTWYSANRKDAMEFPTKALALTRAKQLGRKCTVAEINRKEHDNEKI